MPVDISKALQIPGWMKPEELIWLAEQAQTHQAIAEVGSYYGRSTRALCDHSLGIVHAFDDWYGPRDAAMDYRIRLKLRENFDKFLADHIESGRCVPHEVDHSKVTVAGPFDMIFIDGSHEYFDVQQQLNTWPAFLSLGGMICGHDHELAFPGVVRAVSERYGDQVKYVKGTSIWWAQ